METKIATRKTDELGRIVLPPEASQALRIRNGQSIDIFTKGDTVILKRNNENPLCGLCGGSHAVFSKVEGAYICKECVQKVQMLQV